MLKSQLDYLYINEIAVQETHKLFVSIDEQLLSSPVVQTFVSQVADLTKTLELKKQSLCEEVTKLQT